MGFRGGEHEAETTCLSRGPNHDMGYDQRLCAAKSPRGTLHRAILLKAAE